MKLPEEAPERPKQRKEGKPIPVKRMVSVEQKGFIKLTSIIGQLAFIHDDLGQRIANMPRGRFRYTGALKNLILLNNDLTRSMPEHQRDAMSRQLQSVKIVIGVDASLPRNYDSAFGRWLSFEQLDVVTTAIRECCRMCTISDPQEQKQCMFCRLLEALPTDKPDEDATGCGYFSMW